MTRIMVYAMSDRHAAKAVMHGQGLEAADAGTVSTQKASKHSALEAYQNTFRAKAIQSVHTDAIGSKAAHTLETGTTITLSLLSNT